MDKNIVIRPVRPEDAEQHIKLNNLDRQRGSSSPGFTSAAINGDSLLIVTSGAYSNKIKTASPKKHHPSVQLSSES